MKTFLAILFSCLTLNAATYYVDYSSGDDSLAGTSTATAWKHAPGDPNGTGVSGSATLAAGDTVIYKGGVSYYGQTTLLWSGTSGNPITYDGNSSGVWGVGKAIIEGSNVVWYGFPAFTTKIGSTDAARNYITINNFKLQNIGGYKDDDPILLQDCTSPVTTPIGGTGVQINKGGSGILITNCDFYKIGQWRNEPPFSGVNSITGTGVSFTGVTGGTVANCTFEKLRVPISLKVSGTSGGKLSDITIRSNILGPDFVWGMDVAPSASSLVISNLTYEFNIQKDSASYDSGNWLGCGEKPHTDGIFLRNSGSTNVTWTNIVIQNSVFKCDNPGLSAGGTASIFVSEGPSCTIRNNLFLCEPRATAALAIGFDCLGINQTVDVFNNTFIGGSWRTFQVVVNSDPTFTRLTRIKNNLFLRATDDATGFLNISTNAQSVVDSDYNIYFKPGFTSSTLIFAYDDDGNGSYGAGNTLAQHQARGFDAHSVYADPLFVTSNDFSTPSLINARLSTGSPAIGTGADLSAYGVTTDFTGATRTTWDIGAYQYTVAEQGEGGTSATGSTFTSGSVTIRGGVILR